MGNPNRSEVDFTISEGELAGTYTIFFGTNVMAELEAFMGKPFIAFAAMLDDPELREMSAMRGALFCMLKRHHPEITLEAAGDIIDEFGFVDSMKAIAKCVQLAFPPEKKGSKPEVANFPNRQQRRTAGKAKKPTRKKP